MCAMHRGSGDARGASCCLPCWTKEFPKLDASIRAVNAQKDGLDQPFCISIAGWPSEACDFSMKNLHLKSPGAKGVVSTRSIYGFETWYGPKVGTFQSQKRVDPVDAVSNRQNWQDMYPLGIPFQKMQLLYFV